jgi:hypothetical protein
MSSMSHNVVPFRTEPLLLSHSELLDVDMGKRLKGDVPLVVDVS